MDLEDGVRLGSLCPDSAEPAKSKVPVRAHRPPCATAGDVLPALDVAANASHDMPAHPLCLFTSLTEQYIEGHLVFMASALRHTPMLAADAVPMYVLDQALSERGRARIAASYGPTRWLVPRGPPKDVRQVTKFALNKEKTALFGLRAACGAVLKIDTGDMLVVGSLGALLGHEAIREASTGKHAVVWAAQAMGQPDGNINGGLMLFGRYWLHEATEAALEARAARESREQVSGTEWRGWVRECHGALNNRRAPLNNI